MLSFIQFSLPSHQDFIYSNMKYLSILVLFLLSLSACKSNENNKTDENKNTNTNTETTSSETNTSNSETIDPNEVIKNNQSAGSDASPKNDGSAAAIVFEVKEKNFGTINEGEQVEVTYKFKNIGGSDLVISHVQAGCGCTVPEWPKDPIKPGGSGIVKAKFDSNGRSGHNEKHVTVMSNATENSIDLSFSGEVKPKY